MWLLNDVGNSEPTCFLDVIRPRLACDQDDRQCRVSAPKPPQEVNSTHFRHVDVEKYRVRALRPQNSEPFLGVIDDRRLVALALHGLGEQIGYKDLIINNQDSHRLLSGRLTTEL